MIKVPCSLKFILSIMLMHKDLLVCNFLLCICLASINLIEPILAQTVIDKAFYISLEKELIYPSLAWIFIFSSKYIFYYLQKRVDLKYRIKTYSTIRTYIFSNILKKPLHFFEGKNSSYLISRINNDIENLDGIMLSNVISSSVAFIQILIIFTLMFWISPLLCWITIFMKGVEVALNIVFPLKKLYKNHNEAFASMDGAVQDTLQCIKLIKAANKVNFETFRYEEILKKYYDKRVARDSVNIVREVGSKFITESSYPIIVIIGGLGIFYKILSIGNVIAFLIYFQKLTPLFNEVAYVIPIYKISQASIDRLYELLSIKNEDVDCGETIDRINSIEFKDVSFSYGCRKVLQNISFAIYGNQMNSLVGVSGSGKSTIANLLMGYLQPDSGEILINGKNISFYRLSDIRKNISLLYQEPVIFTRSLEENIAYNSNKDNFNSKYKSIVNSANLNSIIQNFHDDISIILRDNGNNLSGGERQRICLARELYKDASLYIFDEATSALDAVSEKTVMDNINSLAKKRMVFVITHKLVNIQNADNIFVLSNGTIIERGNHNELMNRRGLYYKLYKQQCNIE